MTRFFSVQGWGTMQHYKDRSPPWIKLHNKILEDYNFECLPDASKAHLMLIFLLASRTGNKMNLDSMWVGRKIGATDPVDLQILVDAGFLQHFNDVAPSLQDASKLRQILVDRARAEREERERRERERAEDKKLLSDKPDECLPIFEFWKDVMAKTSTTRFTAQRRDKIQARLKRYTKAEIEQAIKNCRGSRWHMGENPQKKLYNDLALQICRTDTELEKFLEMTADPGKEDRDKRRQVETAKFLGEEGRA